MLRGSTDILNTVCSHLGGIKPGETTKDGKFTVIEVECQGACSNAPMMVVNDDFYVRQLPATTRRLDHAHVVVQEDLTPTTTKTVLDAFSKGKIPKPGPQSGRHSSENSAGLTALTSKVSLFTSGLSLSNRHLWRHYVAIWSWRTLPTRVSIVHTIFYKNRGNIHASKPSRVVATVCAGDTLSEYNHVRIPVTVQSVNI